MRRHSAIAATLSVVALAAALVPVMAASAEDPPTAEIVPASALATAPSGTASPTSTAAPTSTATNTGTATSTATSSSTNTAPDAVDDIAAVRWGSSVVIAVLDNDTDPDGDPLQITAVSAGSIGVAVADGVSVQYTPSGTTIGTDSLTYSVTDGRGGEDTATITVAVGSRQAIRLRAPAKAAALAEQRVTGVVTPIDEALPQVVLSRRTGDRWVTVGSLSVGSDGSLSHAWTARAPGVVQWRAAAVWPDGARSTSTVERVRVVARLDPVVSRVTRRDVPHTWRPGCPVGPDQLRAIELNYWDYHGRLRRGTLIGATRVVSDYTYVFRAAFNGRFAIKKLVPADAYKGVDERAMAAGATSAFNCRHVTGNPYRISQHSWGDAIDINPFENPYATSTRIYPAAAAVRYYHRRSQHLKDPGVITGNSAIARALHRRGWAWGARWANQDFQHWSRNGG